MQLIVNPRLNYIGSVYNVNHADVAVELLPKVFILFPKVDNTIIHLIHLELENLTHENKHCHDNYL